MNNGSIKTIRNRTLALAGLFQATQLVQQTARGERRDARATRACLDSLCKLEAASVDAVYGRINELASGLRALQAQLGDDSKQRSLELTGYVVNLLHLERKLSRETGMLETIRTEIALLNERKPDPIDSPETVATLADIYYRTISTLTPRVMVQGNPDILAADGARNMVRALLLSGIRSAVLWRQCGGNRWSLLFTRKALLRCARSLLQEAQAHG